MSASTIPSAYVEPWLRGTYAEVPAVGHAVLHGEFFDRGEVDAHGVVPEEIIRVEKNVGGVAADQDCGALRATVGVLEGQAAENQIRLPGNG